MNDEARPLSGWRKSRHSGGPNSNCAEVTVFPNGSFGVRDSKNRGPVLRFPAQDWNAFLNSIKNDGH